MSGEISLETWELMRDDLDRRYLDEDPEEANSYPDLTPPENWA